MGGAMALPDRKRTTQGPTKSSFEGLTLAVDKNSIPCDVVAHGSRERLHVLWQIADLIAEIVAEDISVVEADGAMLRLGEPYDSTW